jgi:hypothetical protein
MPGYFRHLALLTPAPGAVPAPGPLASPSQTPAPAPDVDWDEETHPRLDDSYVIRLTPERARVA